MRRSFRIRRGRELGVLFLLVASLAIGGCTLGFGPRGTPTLSADEVLSTAQAIAEQTRQAATPTVTPQPIPPTATEPLESLTPTATATGTVPVVTADYNANVRSGPGENYPIIDVFLEGETASVVGRYDDLTSGTWWAIHRLAQGLDGWVWAGAVTFSGDESTVPYLEPPPTPTETEED